MRGAVSVAPNTDDLPLADGRRRELRGGAEHLLLEQREEQRDAERGDERVERRPFDQRAHHDPLDQPAEQRADDDRDDQRDERAPDASRARASPGPPTAGR